MNRLYKSENWFDGGYWEIDLPEGWSGKRCFDVKNYPYAFESPSGAKLYIGETRSGGALPGEEEEIVPECFMAYREAYLRTLLEARGCRKTTLGLISRKAARNALEQESKVIRHEFGVLVGFAYEREKWGKREWRGWFCKDRWLLLLNVCAEPNDYVSSLHGVFKILESFRFYV